MLELLFFELPVPAQGAQPGGEPGLPSPHLHPGPLLPHLHRGDYLGCAYTVLRPRPGRPGSLQTTAGPVPV